MPQDDTAIDAQITQVDQRISALESELFSLKIVRRELSKVKVLRNGGNPTFEIEAIPKRGRGRPRNDSTTPVGRFYGKRVGEAIIEYLTYKQDPTPEADFHDILTREGCNRYTEAKKKGSIKKALSEKWDRIRLFEGKIYLTEWLNEEQLEQTRRDRAKKKRIRS